MTEPGAGPLRPASARHLPLLQPVLEVGPLDPLPSWPVADVGPWLALSGALTAAEVGAAVARIAAYNHLDDRTVWPGDDDPLTAVLPVAAAGPEPGALVVPGGLRLTDPGTGARVDPGCCSDLNDWREWYRIPAGASPDLGHDPDPWVERRPGGTLRVWADEQGGSWVDVPVDELTRLVDGVQVDLTGFLRALRSWAEDVVPAGADALVASLDRHLRVSGPGTRPRP
ncbi:hypothetical protein ACSNN9_19985 [Micromonospora sp. URMC 107]|uniref:hypothetical protein n=1 Tax=Micromonospora sp. URMC 107 TaxID=3423418 RepID=UPI003F1CC59A